MNRQQVLDRLRGFEGCVSYLYRCTGGEVTIGIGHALADAAAAAQLAWVIAERPALPGEVQADYAKVAAAPKGMLAAKYAPLTQCRLDQDTINQLADADIAYFESRLAARFPGWNTFPEPAQQALFDMAFNLGTAGLSKFPKMLAAVNAGDWETAAAECERQGISKQRNQATAALFLQAKSV